MKEELPLAPTRREGQVFVEGARIDMIRGLVEPMHLNTIGRLLARVFRYGIQSPLESHRRNSVLLHSACVGELARGLAAGVTRGSPGLVGIDGKPLHWSHERVLDMLGIYGALHDVGEIFGGDLPAYLPEAVTREIKQYQSACRVGMLMELGVPAPNIQLYPLLKLADMLAPFWECRQAALEDWAIAGWEDKVDALSAELGMDMDRDGLCEFAVYHLQQFTSKESGFPTMRQSMRLWRRHFRSQIVAVSSLPNNMIFGVASLVDFGAHTRDPDSYKKTILSMSGGRSAFLWNLHRIRLKGRASVIPHHGDGRMTMMEAA